MYMIHAFNHWNLKFDAKEVDNTIHCFNFKKPKSIDQDKISKK